MAYTDVGDGYPLIAFTGGPLCNAVLEWETDGVAEYYAELARRFKFIRVEPRGGPNSDGPRRPAPTANTSWMHRTQSCRKPESPLTR